MTTPNDGTPGAGNSTGTPAGTPAGSGTPANASGTPAGTPAGTPTQVTDERYGAPEKYEAPKDANFGNDLQGALHGLGKDLNLSAKGMEKVYAVARAHAQSTEKVFNDAHNANLSNWQTQTAQDTEFGGEKLAENRSIAAKGMDLVASPTLKAILKESGLENHPEFFRAFYRMGKLVAEDRIVRGNPGSPAQGGTFTYAKSDHK